MRDSSGTAPPPHNNNFRASPLPLSLSPHCSPLSRAPVSCAAFFASFSCSALASRSLRCAAVRPSFSLDCLSCVVFGGVYRIGRLRTSGKGRGEHQTKTKTSALPAAPRASAQIAHRHALAGGALGRARAVDVALLVCVLWWLVSVVE